MKSLYSNDLGNRAICLHKLGRWREAMRDYDHSISIDPTNGDLYFQRALAHYENNQLAEVPQLVLLLSLSIYHTYLSLLCFQRL